MGKDKNFNAPKLRLRHFFATISRMKLVSWNVNGLRAILKKGFEEIFASLNADIFLIGETKYTEKPSESFPFIPKGYFLYQTTSKVRKGYSGIAIYTKEEPLSIQYGLQDGEYDEEGRLITLEYPSFYYVGVYVPNSGEGLKRLSFREKYEQDILKHLNELKEKKPVIYTGDLNVAHEEIDLKNPATNHQNPGFTDEERSWFTRLLDSGYKDTFRSLYPDKVTYSWWSYRSNARQNNAGWRIDYFLVSENLFSKVKDSRILTDIYGSDHCPIMLDIAL